MLRANIKSVEDWLIHSYRLYFLSFPNTKQEHYGEAQEELRVVLSWTEEEKINHFLVHKEVATKSFHDALKNSEELLKMGLIIEEALEKSGLFPRELNELHEDISFEQKMIKEYKASLNSLESLTAEEWYEKEVSDATSWWNTRLAVYSEARVKMEENNKNTEEIVQKMNLDRSKIPTYES